MKLFALLLLLPSVVLAGWLPMDQFDLGGGGWLMGGTFHPEDPDIMVIGGDYTGGIYRSDTRGVNWYPWNEGLYNNDGESTMYIEDLLGVVDSDGDVSFYAATHGGIYRRRDNGLADWVWVSGDSKVQAPYCMTYDSDLASIDGGHVVRMPFACLSVSESGELFAGAGRSRYQKSSYETDYYPEHVVTGVGSQTPTYTVWRTGINGSTESWTPVAGSEGFGSVRDISVADIGGVTYVAVASRNGIYLYNDSSGTWTALDALNVRYRHGGSSVVESMGYSSDVGAWSIHLTSRGDLYVAMTGDSSTIPTGAYGLYRVTSSGATEWVYLDDGQTIPEYKESMTDVGYDGSGAGEFIGWPVTPQFMYMTIREGSGADADIVYLGDRKSYFGLCVGSNPVLNDTLFGQTEWSNSVSGYTGNWLGGDLGFTTESGWLQAWGASVIFHPMLFPGVGTGGEVYMGIQYNGRFHVSEDGGETWINSYCSYGADGWRDRGYAQTNNWGFAFQDDGRVVVSAADIGVARSTSEYMQGYEWIRPVVSGTQTTYGNGSTTYTTYGVAVRPRVTGAEANEIFITYSHPDVSRTGGGKLLVYRDAGVPEWINPITVAEIDDLELYKMMDIVFVDRDTCFVTYYKYPTNGIGDGCPGVLRGDCISGSWTWVDATSELVNDGQTEPFSAIMYNEFQGNRLFLAGTRIHDASSGGVWVLEDPSQGVYDWERVYYDGPYALKNFQALAQSPNGDRVYAATSGMQGGGAGVVRCVDPSNADQVSSWNVLQGDYNFGLDNPAPVWADGTWNPDSAYGIYALAVSPYTNFQDRVYAGLRANGFSKSEGVWVYDGSAWGNDKWIHASKYEEYNGAGILSLAYNPYVQGQMFIGTMGLGAWYHGNTLKQVEQEHDEPQEGTGRLATLRLWKNGATSFSYVMPSPTELEIGIYDLRGKVISTMSAYVEDTAVHTYHWDGRDAGGKRAGSGVYLVRIRSKHGAGVTKFVLSR